MNIIAKQCFEEKMMVIGQKVILIYLAQNPVASTDSHTLLEEIAKV